MGRVAGRLGRLFTPETTLIRPSGLLGRLDGHIPVGLYELPHYVAGSLPAPPAEVPVPAVASWGMLGNNKKGDCGVAGLEHGFMADAAITGEREQFATDAEALAYYDTYTGGRDSGVVLVDFLEYVRQHRYYANTVSAYAPVAPRDLKSICSVISLYGFAYTGIVVTSSMPEAFEANQPWTTSTIYGSIVGGHCVPIVGYDEHYLYLVTWGEIQAVSYRAWLEIADEAWAVITGELIARHGNGRGVDITALVADLPQLRAA